MILLILLIIIFVFRISVSKCAFEDDTVIIARNEDNFKKNLNVLE